MRTKRAVPAIGMRNALAIQRAVYRSLRAISHWGRRSGIPVVTTRLFSEPRRQVFFGYYDTSPFSSDGKYVLASHTPLGNVSPTPRDQLIVGHYRLEDGGHAFAELGRTTTWCWQQGCRLQWYPSHNSEQVLYNKMVDDQYGCVIQNIQTGQVVREYSRPLYCVSHDGKWGLSLDFSRLQRLRPGYGYTNLRDRSCGKPVPDDDGVWRIDMNTGEEKLLFTLKDIAALDPKPAMKGGDHYFNHLCLGPNSKRFMFFHLCDRKGERSNRLLTSDVEGHDVHLLENERMVSHYAWRSEKELLVTTSNPDTGLQYVLYDDASGEKRVVGQALLKQDGHPSYFPSLECILTDTYPDRCGYCHILIYGDKNKTLSRVASFYSPIAFSGEVRCDLHPRLNSDGTVLCADIVHQGRRAIWVCRLASLP